MKTDNSDFLGKDKLFPLLIRLSVPAIIAMLVMALYNVVDTIFVGRGAGSLAIAGLAIAFPIQLVVGATGQTIGVGGASLISRKLGEGDKGKAEATLGTSLFFSLVISLCLTLFIALYLESILKLFGATEAILPYGLDYLTVILLGFPVNIMGMAGNSLIRAEGNSRMAMLTMVIGVALNIILDPIFIFGLDMGIQGAAIATVISQVVSFVWMAMYYIQRKSVVRLKLKHFAWRKDILGEVLILGLPNFIQMAGMGFIATMINNILGTHGGEIAISTYGIIVRLISFVVMPLSGLAQGFQPIAGFNYGARNYDRVRKVLLLALVLSTAIALFFYAIIMLLPGLLIGMFTTDQSLLDYATPALKTMALLTPIIGLQIISSIYFQAVGKGMQALFLGLSRQFIILLPIVLVFSRLYGAEGVWISFPLSDGLATIITVAALLLELKKLDKQRKGMPRIIAEPVS